MGGQCQAPAALPLGKTRYPLYGRLCGFQGRSGLVRKISPPLVFDPRIAQHVGSLISSRHFHQLVGDASGGALSNISFTPSFVSFIPNFVKHCARNCVISTVLLVNDDEVKNTDRTNRVVLWVMAPCVLVRGLQRVGNRWLPSVN